jgi:2'-hydroxyisoflavone reductase
MGRLLDTCREASGSDAHVAWVGEDFLAEKEVGPWIELPLWIPESDPDAIGFSDVDCGKAIGEGLTFRELAETVRATLDWDATRPADREWRAGLKPDRETELLLEWHSRA